MPSGLPVYAETRATANSGGTASGTITVPGPDWWKITRLSATGTSTTKGQLRVYRGTTGAMIAGSAYPNADASQEDDLVLAPGETLRAEWSALAAGAAMRFSIEGKTL